MEHLIRFFLGVVFVWLAFLVYLAITLISFAVFAWLIGLAVLSYCVGFLLCKVL